MVMLSKGKETANKGEDEGAMAERDSLVKKEAREQEVEVEGEEDKSRDKHSGSDSNSSSSSSSSSSSKVIGNGRTKEDGVVKKRRKNHGVACCFCKKRRKRCDGGFPRCGACVNAGIPCTFVDSVTGRELPRDYIEKLEAKVARLESEGERRDQSPRQNVELLIPKLFTKTYWHVNNVPSFGIGNGSTGGAAANPKPSYETGHKLLELYKDRVQRRYPFLDWPWVLECFKKVFQQETVEAEATTFVYLILAIAAEMSEVPEERNSASKFYSIALEHGYSTLDGNSVRSVQLCLLLTIRLLVKPTDRLDESYDKLWHLAGVTVRTAVALDLHRKLGSPRGMVDGLEQHVLQNLRSTVFWCAYSIERLIAMTVGRPFCISDVDIDAPLPEEEPEEEEEAQQEGGKAPSSSNSGVIQMFKLRRIQSSICMCVFGPRKFLDNEDEVNQTRQQILLELGEWKNAVPNTKDLNKWARISYHQSAIWLLRPVLLQIEQNTLTNEAVEWFQVLRNSASEISSSYNDVLCPSLLPLSNNLDPLTTVHSLFVAGVTYMYCIWLDRKLKLTPSKNQLHDLEISIAVIKLYERMLLNLAEQFPIAIMQKEIFMLLSERILESISGNADSVSGTGTTLTIGTSTLVNDPNSDCESNSSIQSFVKPLNNRKLSLNSIKESHLYSFKHLNGDTILRTLLCDLLEQLI